MFFTKVQIIHPSMGVWNGVFLYLLFFFSKCGSTRFKDAVAWRIIKVSIFDFELFCTVHPGCQSFRSSTNNHVSISIVISRRFILFYKDLNFVSGRIDFTGSSHFPSFAFFNLVNAIIVLITRNWIVRRRERCGTTLGTESSKSRLEFCPCSEGLIVHYKL